MIFTAYFGNEDDLLSWQKAVHKHADWLGLMPGLKSRQLYDGRKFSFGWLKPQSTPRNARLLETEEYLVMNTLNGTNYEEDLPRTEPMWQRLISNVHTNEIKFGLSLRSGEIRIVVPPATPEQFYFSQDSRGFVFSNDMRLMMRWGGLELDERAIYALFQYNAIPPPMTMSKKIQRVPNGHVLKLMPNSDEPIFEVIFHPLKPFQEDRKIFDPEKYVLDAIDDILAGVPTSTVLYFSGGVDSALLASRLTEMDRKDIKLINYAFGSEDPEGQLALQMAEQLGLTCEQVMYDPSDVPLMLERLGKDYSFPFGDKSVIPTNLLIHASLGSIEESLTVIEGTGADGAFGMGLKYPMWKRMLWIPGSIRWMLGQGYKWLKLWRYNSNIERFFHIARRSVQMPLQHAAIIAQNSFHGIAYTIPDIVRDALEEAIRTRIEVLFTGLEAKEQISLLDLIHVCAGEFAAKSFDPLHTRGINPIYPFLEPPMLRVSSSLNWDEKCNGSEAKSLLKTLLVRKVPRKLVYRPKGSFNPPFREILTYDSTQEFLRGIVMSENNPLIDFCKKAIIKQIIDRAQRGQSLNIETYFFLAVLMFTSGWLNQVEY